MANKRLALLEEKPAGTLLVHEIYRSLQGESTYAGLPCVFVRLSVCDARCVWCDTPHAFNQGSVMQPEAVVEHVLGFDCPLVEVTGGEPLLQSEVLPLMKTLCDRGKTVMLETSGAHDISVVDPRVKVIMDIKCPDSGEHERNHWPNLGALQDSAEIKFVIASRRDFDWAVGVIQGRGLSSRTLLVSAAWDTVPLTDLGSWLLDSKVEARLQLQMHKYIWGAETRGV